MQHLPPFSLVDYADEFLGSPTVVSLLSKAPIFFIANNNNNEKVFLSLVIFGLCIFQVMGFGVKGVDFVYARLTCSPMDRNTKAETAAGARFYGSASGPIVSFGRDPEIEMKDISESGIEMVFNKEYVFSK